MQDLTNLSLYVPFIYLLAAVPYVWLGLYAWRKRPALAVTPFAWAMLGMSLWSFAYSLEIFVPDLSLKLLFKKIEFLGIVSIPVFLLFFSLEFTGNSHLLTLRSRLLLWAIPFATLTLVWTNEFHHLVWEGAVVVATGKLGLLNVHYGLFHWAQFAFDYLLIIFAGILLVMEMIQRPGIYRAQAALVILSILAPWIGNLILDVMMDPVPILNITPLLFLPTGLGLSWAIVRFRLLEILPLEHLSVLKNMRDGVIAVNSSHRILFINPISEKLLDCREAEAIGQPLSQVSGMYWDRLAPLLTETEYREEITIGEDDQALIFEATVSPVVSREHSSPDHIITLHDITGRKEAENALSRREAIMSAISLSAEQFLKESAWEYGIPAVLEKIGQAVNLSRVYVAMNYLDEKGVLHSSLCYEWAAPGLAPQIDNPSLQHVPLRQAGFSRWEKHLSQDLPIHGSVREFPESEQGLLSMQGSLSVAVMPILVEGQWWGFVMFDECRTERHWTGMELKALRTFASILGSAESRTRAEQKLLRRQNALSLLQDIVREALEKETLRGMAEDLVARMAGLISADECFITLWDEPGTQASPLVSYGTSRDTYLPLQPISGGHTITELALHRGHALTVDDVFVSHQFDREIAACSPVRSLIAVPLISRKHRHGAIILAFRLYHRFTPEEITICEQASELIALAFEKFKVMELAQRRADTSETLRKAGVAVSETLDMGAAVTHILEQLERVVPYDSASVQLLDGNELEIIGGRGWENPDDVVGIRFRIPADNPNSVVIETKAPYLLADAGKVYKAFNEPPHDHIRSWLGIPLMLQDKIIGLLAIDSAEADHFTNDDITLAVTFANQVSIALENARIFKETQDQAVIDHLTGIFNRRGLFLAGEEKFAFAMQEERAFSCIMIDVDHFKRVNDTHGHDAGDVVLKELAATCKRCVREIDLVGRYGGEEIVILLPDASLEASLMIAERVRATIENSPVDHGGLVIPITVSLGVACRDENTTTLDTLVKRADQAMYIAKHRGRNRVAFNK